MAMSWLAGLVVGAVAGLVLVLCRGEDMESLNYIYCAKCSDKMVWIHGVNLQFTVSGEVQTIRICKACNAREQSNDPGVPDLKRADRPAGADERDERLRRLLE